MKVESIWFQDLSLEERRFLERPGDSPLPHTTDVLIIGAGMVGLFTAWFLRQSFDGSICVMDSLGISHGASGHNTGGLFAGQTSHTHPRAFRDWAIQARELYAELATSDGPLADPGIDFVRSGSLRIDGKWPGSLSDYAASENQRGNHSQALSQTDLSDFEPLLSSRFTEGFYCDDDATFHPLRTALALAHDLRRNDVPIITHTPVTDFMVSAGRLNTIVCTDHTISAGEVVLTSGWAAGEMSSRLGFTLPLGPVKGQAIATTPQEFTMRTCLLGPTMARQLENGRIVAGGTQEFVGPDLEATEAGQRHVLGDATEMVPALAHATLDRTWVGLRPHTPDGMPVVDRLPDSENVFLAAGHFTKGVLLAPVTGRAIADWITTGSPTSDLQHLSASRFSDPAT
ncbi:MAG TPA: hypothetical protein DCE39_06480 [Planctomycetaceae bacterium]|nr:hypothetical protein [Planctomycetaceae bacterium]|tara:strand:- start:5630 stop:6829 length:1200 start_codon:yes stop_codon:yes gene_type:complete